MRERLAWSRAQPGQALAASVLAHAIALVWLAAPAREEPPQASPALRVRLTVGEPSDRKRAPMVSPKPGQAVVVKKKKEGAPAAPAARALAQQAAAREEPIMAPEPKREPEPEPAAADPAPLPVEEPSLATAEPEAQEGDLSEPEPEAYADIEMDIAPDGGVIAAWVVRSKPEGAAFVAQALSSALAARFAPYAPEPGQAPLRKKFRAVYELGSAGALAPAEHVGAPPGAGAVAAPGGARGREHEKEVVKNAEAL